MQSSPVQRAFTLAKTGRFRNKTEIARVMRDEGYTYDDLVYLEGAHLSRQIAGLCADARLTYH